MRVAGGNKVLSKFAVVVVEDVRGKSTWVLLRECRFEKLLA